MRTDTERLNMLMVFFESACATESESTGQYKVSKEEARSCLQFLEAAEAGFKLGLRGRELIDAAMNAVRFDVEPEKAREVTEQMVAERRDTERLDDIERFVAAGTLDHITTETHDGASYFVVQLDGEMRYAHGKGVTLRSALDNVRDLLDARDQAREVSQAPDA